MSYVAVKFTVQHPKTTTASPHAHKMLQCQCLAFQVFRPIPIHQSSDPIPIGSGKTHEQQPTPQLPSQPPALHLNFDGHFWLVLLVYLFALRPMEPKVTILGTLVFFCAWMVFHSLEIFIKKKASDVKRDSNVGRRCYSRTCLQLDRQTVKMAPIGWHQQ